MTRKEKDGNRQKNYSDSDCRELRSGSKVFWHVWSTLAWSILSSSFHIVLFILYFYTFWFIFLYLYLYLHVWSTLAWSILSSSFSYSFIYLTFLYILIYIFTSLLIFTCLVNTSLIHIEHEQFFSLKTSDKVLWSIERW